MCSEENMTTCKVSHGGNMDNRAEEDEGITDKLRPSRTVRRSYDSRRKTLSTVMNGEGETE